MMRFGLIIICVLGSRLVEIRVLLRQACLPVPWGEGPTVQCLLVGLWGVIDNIEIFRSNRTFNHCTNAENYPFFFFFRTKSKERTLWWWAAGTLRSTWSGRRRTLPDRTSSRTTGCRKSSKTKCLNQNLLCKVTPLTFSHHLIFFHFSTGWFLTFMATETFVIWQGSPDKSLSSWSKWQLLEGGVCVCLCVRVVLSH